MILANRTHGILYASKTSDHRYERLSKNFIIHYGSLLSSIVCPKLPKLNYNIIRQSLRVYKRKHSTLTHWHFSASFKKMGGGLERGLRG